MSYIAKNLNPNGHCFFGSEGGVSVGKYASLNTNLKSQDDRNTVLKNFDILCGKFGLTPKNLVTIRQGVSNVAFYADSPQWFLTQADGVVTDKPDILLGIKTADCAPVLLADYQSGVIGVAHAGWRGAYKGIIENVLDIMLQKGAKKKNICASIGPCMQQASFEVMADMKKVLLDLSLQNERYFKNGADTEHFFFDLSGFVEDKLHNLGVENVENSRIDTYPAENGYFSYRRNTRLGLITEKFDYPTQYSCIKL